MNPAFALLFIVGSFLYLLRYRFRDNFLRVYGLFFLILVVYATNKAYFGISPEMSESAGSPLSLLRWALLGLFVWQAWRYKMPDTFRLDVPLTTLSVLLLSDMLLSAIYAESFSYSFLRAMSFVLLAYALMKGMTYYFFSSVNCLRYFQLKYYAAWILLFPAIVMLLSGWGYGITIIMNQYAGFFGNQNMFGTFSALITPYVIFHWRIVAQKRWEKVADGALLLTILIGLVRGKAVALLLGPAGLGLIALYQSLIGFGTSVAGMGLRTAGTRQMAEAMGQDDAAQVASVRRALLWATIVLAWLGAATFWLARDQLALRLLGDPARARDVGLLGIGVALGVVGGSQTALLTGLRRIGDTTRIGVWSALLSAVAGCAVLALFGESGVIAFVLAAPLFTFLLGYARIRRLDLPRKKRRCTPASRIGPTSPRRV